MTAREPDDAHYIERIRQHNDQQAFAALVERYVRLAGSVAYGVIGEYHLAADVTQDAFIKMHRSLDQLRDPKSFRSWFLRMVRTTAIDHRRRRQRQAGVFLSQLEGIEEELEGQGRATLDELAAAEERARVRQIVGELPEQYRELVALKYLQQLSYEEIAQVTGLTVSAVESRLFRARKQLKQQLDGLASQ